MALQTEFVEINEEPEIVQQLLFTKMETEKRQSGEDSADVGDGMSVNDSDDDYQETVVEKDAADQTDQVADNEAAPEDQVQVESEICIITLIPDYTSVDQDQGAPLTETLPYQNSMDKDSFILKQASDVKIKQLVKNVNKTPTAPYYCRICQKEFHSKNGMLFHERNYHTDAHIFCPDCKKGFKLLSDLDRHMNVHSGNRPFKCDMCDKAFVSKSSLTQHKKLKHIVGYKYKCDICNKMFNTEIDIIRHGRTHTGVKPFKCDQCSKSFTCKSSLKTHQRVHEGKTLKCHFCEMSFYIESDRARHETRHTGVKPHKCELCGNGYSCKSTLSVHYKNAHSTINDLNRNKKQKKEKKQRKEKIRKNEAKCVKLETSESVKSTEVTVFDNVKIKTENEPISSKKPDQYVEDNIDEN